MTKNDPMVEIKKKKRFLAISMRNIDLARKCLSTKWKSVKNATFFFFTQTSSSKTVEDMTILDLGRVSRTPFGGLENAVTRKWPKIWENF